MLPVSRRGRPVVFEVDRQEGQETGWANWHQSAQSGSYLAGGFGPCPDSY